MTTAREPIAIAGAGYVGLVTAAGLVANGHEVWCAERDVARLERLSAGEVDLTEPGLPEKVRDALDRGRLHFVQHVSQAIEDSSARLLFVAVGTPSQSDGAASLEQVESVIDQIPCDSTITVAMKSTVPPGTGAKMIDRAARAGQRFAYASCPEFLQEGRALQGVREPDRIVIGADDEAAAVLEAVHAPLTVEREARGETPVPLIVTDVRTAETIKHTANFFLALRISFVNQIANLCEELDADVATVMKGIGLDHRIGTHFLRPGIGFGGSCLLKDVKALSAAAHLAGADLTLGDALIAVNECQVDRVVRKLLRRFGSLKGRTIALLGLAFKAKTNDIRSGSAFELALRLRHHGAVIRAFDPDPLACEQAVGNAAERATRREWIAPDELAKDALDALQGAHACVLVTEWSDFQQIDWEAAKGVMSGDLVIDGRNALDAAAVRDAGLTYEGTGRESAGLWRAIEAGETAAAAAP
jgi:UDPglucose 6-dehydrogenase